MITFSVCPITESNLLAESQLKMTMPCQTQIHDNLYRIRSRGFQYNLWKDIMFFFLYICTRNTRESIIATGIRDVFWCILNRQEAQSIHKLAIKRHDIYVQWIATYTAFCTPLKTKYFGEQKYGWKTEYCHVHKIISSRLTCSSWS